MINIWICSVITSKTNLFYLYNAIVSIIIQTAKPRLVLSIYSTVPLDSIYKLLANYNNSDIIVRTSPLSQFEHIKSLVETQNLADEEFVVFCDDDDLILELPKELNSDINGFVGYQFIGQDIKGNIIPGQEDATIVSVGNLIRQYHSTMIWADDFSGTSIRFKYLKQYFNTVHLTIPKVVRQLEDTDLMKFIEDKVPNTINFVKNKRETAVPFVFHRLKSNGSMWQSNLSSDILESIREYQNVKV